MYVTVLAEAAGLAEIVDVVKVVAAVKAADRAVVVGVKVETGLTEAELLDEVGLVGDERASISDESK
jgi:hypothetical protein